MLKKIRVFGYHIIAVVISIYVFSFWGLHPQTPTRAVLLMDPAGETSVPSSPVLSHSKTNFWLRPWEWSSAALRAPQHVQMHYVLSCSCMHASRLLLTISAKL